MARVGRGHCAVCEHPKRHLIDLGLTLGVGCVTLAQRFGVSKHSILRHSKAHLTVAQRAALAVAAKPSEIDLEQLRTSESEGLLGSLVAQRARLGQIVEMCIEGRQPATAVSAENGITHNLSLTAKLLGQLATHHHVTHTNLLVSPDYCRLRAALLRALKPFPQALASVTQALRSLESEAAKDISGPATRPEPALIEHAPPGAPATPPDVLPPLPPLPPPC